jgi:RNA polymerase sigma-70 factor (ECF subfamily)
MNEPASDLMVSQLEATHPAAYRWALSCCRGDRTEAEEVLQAAYLKVLDGRAIFGEHSSWRTWLFGVIRRTASEHRRRRLLRGEWLLNTFRRVPEPTITPVDPILEIEQARALRRALQSLSQRQRQLIELVFRHDLTIEQAGEVLGISIGSARTHNERAKARLKQQLA